MRIVIHDRPGYAFSVQLGRELGARGHAVLYLHDALFQSPQGGFIADGPPAPGLEVEGLRVGRSFRKYALVRRAFRERAYGRQVAARVVAYAPDAVISANTPPDAQGVVFAACRTAGIRFITWMHDLHGVAIRAILGRRLAVAGRLFGWYYHRREGRIARDSDAVVAITEDFLPATDAWRIGRGRVEVIPNWAPIEDIPVRPKVNDWARRHGVADKFCFLYAGTLGLKHEPELLLRLGQHFDGCADVRVLVASEGLGADWLAERARTDRGGALRLLGFQGMVDFPDMVGAADVLVAVLTADAATFSVPSKVLSYLCAQRALLLGMPAANLAARTVARAGAGVVVPPGDPEGFVAAAEGLRADPARRHACARDARAYAERTFGIQGITDRFERILGGGG